MAWEKFVKKEVRSKDTWKEPEITYMEKITVDQDNNWYFEIDGSKHMLPIQNICKATCTQDRQSNEYLLNNREVAIIFKPTGKIKKFFRIPSVIPETLVYYSDGLVAGISKTREEIISFTVGGQFADSEFSISNYTVAIRLEDCKSMYADKGHLYVLYSEGVCVLEPTEA